jgi:hypothetical protein
MTKEKQKTHKKNKKKSKKNHKPTRSSEVGEGEQEDGEMLMTGKHERKRKMKRKKKKKTKKKKKMRRKKTTTVDPGRDTTFHAVRWARKGSFLAPYKRSQNQPWERKPHQQQDNSSADGNSLSVAQPSPRARAELGKTATPMWRKVGERQIPCPPTPTPSKRISCALKSSLICRAALTPPSPPSPVLTTLSFSPVHFPLPLSPTSSHSITLTNILVRFPSLPSERRVSLSVVIIPSSSTTASSRSKTTPSPSSSPSSSSSATPPSPK